MRTNNETKEIFNFLLKSNPQAIANISGGEKYPNIKGNVYFYELPLGVILVSQVENLPSTKTNIFAYHLHEGEKCENDFSLTGPHFNPQNVEHPNHAGDLPPLMAMDGNAWFSVYDTRFKIDEIIGRTIIIHDNVDDFTSQPAGNSGEKIACGVIVRNV